MINNSYLAQANMDNMFDELEIKTKANSSIVKEIKNETDIKVNTEPEKAERKLIIVTNADRELAVSAELIPECYKDSKFDSNMIKSNIKKMLENNPTIKIVNFNNYVDICSSILTGLRLGQVPKGSYIIGAPNGFGKTSFVTEAIILMKKLGWMTVPYRSLQELCIIRNREEKMLLEAKMLNNAYGVYNHQYGVFMNKDELKEFKETKELPAHLKPLKPVIPYYDWDEYINAKCLFTFFSGVESKQVESRMLGQLLSIRSAKGLPTIVTISTSLNPYTQDLKLREEIWEDIMSYDDVDRLDRVKHISCYKRRSDYISMDNNSNNFTE